MVEHEVETEVSTQSLTLDTAETDGSAVTVSLGVTENLGDFRSAKISVAVTVPTTVSRLARAGRHAYSTADRLLNDLAAEFIPTTESNAN